MTRNAYWAHVLFVDFSNGNAPDVEAGVPREAHTLGFRLSPNGAVLSDYQQIRGANPSFEADGRKFRKKVNRIVTIQQTCQFMAVA